MDSRGQLQHLIGAQATPLALRHIGRVYPSSSAPPRTSLSTYAAVEVLTHASPEDFAHHSALPPFEFLFDTDDVIRAVPPSTLAPELRRGEILHWSRHLELETSDPLTRFQYPFRSRFTKSL